LAALLRSIAYTGRSGGGGGMPLGTGGFGGITPAGLGGGPGHPRAGGPICWSIRSSRRWGCRVGGWSVVVRWVLPGPAAPRRAR